MGVQSDPLVQSFRSFQATSGKKRIVLADEIGISEPALNKFCIGRYGPHVRSLVEAYLSKNQQDLNVARADLGEYSREQAQKYVGEHVFIRPDFMNPGDLCAFETVIEWDVSLPGLRWRAWAAVKFEKTAVVAIARQSSYVQISHIDRGWCSLMSVTPIDHNGRMFGSMFAMGDIIPQTSFAPVLAPIVLWKRKLSKADYGLIDAKHPRFQEFNDWIVSSRKHHVRTLAE